MNDLSLFDPLTPPSTEVRSNNSQSDIPSSTDPTTISGAGATTDSLEVLLAVRLDQNFLEGNEEDHDERVRAWCKWLKGMPSGAEHVSVQGIYRSCSTLVILSLPVLLWNLLPDNPAYSFVGFIRSPNLLHHPSALKNQKGTDQELKHILSDGESKVGKQSVYDNHHIQSNLAQIAQQPAQTFDDILEAMGKPRLIRAPFSIITQSTLTSPTSSEMATQRNSITSVDGNDKLLPQTPTYEPYGYKFIPHAEYESTYSRGRKSSRDNVFRIPKTDDNKYQETTANTRDTKRSNSRTHIAMRNAERPPHSPFVHRTARSRDSGYSEDEEGERYATRVAKIGGQL